jgi:hypothetical protein
MHGMESFERGEKSVSFREKFCPTTYLALSNPILLPTACSRAFICCGRERGWITFNYPTVLKEKIIEKQKEYDLRYLLAKVPTT